MSSLRDRRRESTEAEIESAAVGLIAERGIEATTCPDIAAAAEISLRTFYRYGENKVHAAFRSLRVLDEQVSSAIAEHAMQDSLSLSTCEQAILEVISDPGNEDCLSGVLRLHRLFGADPALRTAAQQHNAQSVERLLENLSSRTPESGLDPLERRVVATTALGVFHAALDAWAVGDGPAGTGELRTHYLRAARILAEG